MCSFIQPGRGWLWFAVGCQSFTPSTSLPLSATQWGPGEGMGAQPATQTVLLPHQQRAEPHPALVLLQGVSRGLGTTSAAASQRRAAHPPPPRTLPQTGASGAQLPPWTPLQSINPQHAPSNSPHRDTRGSCSHAGLASAAGPRNAADSCGQSSTMAPRRRFYLPQTFTARCCQGCAGAPGRSLLRADWWPLSPLRRGFGMQGEPRASPGSDGDVSHGRPPAPGGCLL